MDRFLADVRALRQQLSRPTKVKTVVKTVTRHVKAKPAPKPRAASKPRKAAKKAAPKKAKKAKRKTKELVTYNHPMTQSQLGHVQVRERARTRMLALAKHGGF